MFDRLIPVARLSDLIEKVARINRRAAKHGLGEFRLSLGETTRERRAGQTQTYRAVTIDGPVIRVPGFRFLGRVDHTGDINLTLSVPGQSIPAKYRDAAPDCDHCRLSRNRSDTFVLVEESTGATRQIGRNCLADYIGHNPEGVLAMFGYLRTISDDANEAAGFAGYTLGADPEDILAYTGAAIAAWGWTSKRDDCPEAGKFATANEVSRHMLGTVHDEARLSPTDEHRTTAIAALAWILTDMPRRSEYEHNLAAIMSRALVEPRLFGFACSGLQAYFRHVERTIAARATASPAPAHWGTIGERTTLTVQVLRSYRFEGRFGPTTVYTFRNQTGADLVWFASNDPGFERGTTLRVKATVKKHGRNARTGQPETMLSRVALAA